ncbi:hypothetical protein AAF712_004846 [Marasmius tenuissimus]|uniref:MYND-type domain-containing protein n=1 Tax=Marasmius tenuissimus TaxID=585030 RepID=A0ABR3A2T2_9AGAR
MSQVSDALREELPIRNLPYFAKALSRFPTISSTLEQIRRIGNPTHSIDISHPDTKTLNAIEVIGALACHMQAKGPLTAAFVRRHWSTFFSRWIKFLLEKFILVEPQNSPNTPQGVDAVEHILTGVPIFLSFPEDGAADEIIAVVSASPYLLHLVSQVWCKTIDTSHHTWGTWTIALGIVVAGSHPQYTPPQIRDPSTPTLYRAKQGNLGEILSRHISHEAQRLPTMDLRDLGYFKMFMMVICQPRCFDTEHPTMLHKNLQYSVPAYVAVLRGLLHKRKSLRNASIDGRECTDAQQIAMPMMISLSEPRMHDPYRVREMLKDGLIEAIFKAYPCFFLNTAAAEPTVGDPFGNCAVGIIELISKYLGYSSVLRQFLRTVKKITDAPGDLEGKVRGKSSAIWSSWEGAKAKANGFYRLYQNVKETGMCSSEECRTHQVLPAEELRQLQFSRCVGCLTAVYCSRGCQKAHWITVHRERCSQTAKILQDGMGIVVPYHDFKLWQKWIDLYISRNAEYIMAAHRRYISSNRTNPYIQNGSKNPILILDFDQPRIPAPVDCVEWTDPVTLLTRKREQYGLTNTGQVERYNQKWAEPTVNERNVLVMAIFSRNDKFPFPCQALVEFPLRNREVKSIEVDGIRHGRVGRAETQYEVFERDILNPRPLGSPMYI